MAIEASKLDRRMDVLSPVDPPIRDATGGVVASWSVSAQTYGQLLPISTKDWIASTAENNEITALINVRDHVPVKAKDRILDLITGDIYEVRGVMPVIVDCKKQIRCTRIYI